MGRPSLASTVRTAGSTLPDAALRLVASHHMKVYAIASCTRTVGLNAYMGVYALLLSRLTSIRATHYRMVVVERSVGPKTDMGWLVVGRGSWVRPAGPEGHALPLTGPTEWRVLHMELGSSSSPLLTPSKASKSARYTLSVLDIPPWTQVQLVDPDQRRCLSEEWRQKAEPRMVRTALKGGRGCSRSSLETWLVQTAAEMCQQSPLPPPSSH